MASLIRNISEFYHYVNDDLADPRTNNLFLVSNPFVIIGILILYHQFVRKWGLRWMEKRPAFEFKGLIAVYNVIQIILCAFLTSECLTKLYIPGHYSLWCQKMIYDDTEIENVVINRVYLYYLIKVLDLLDTVFFVLRKKNNQISFLHVYHHMGMCLLGYVGTKYVPGGHGVMLGCVNSFVHTVMYIYYLIALLKKEWIRSWWKKYITQLQIIQFVILIFHFGHVIFEPSCEYPKWVSFMFLPHNVFILSLFCDFYIKEYVMKNKTKTK